MFAVDARTGKEKWRWDPHVGHQNFPPGSEGNPDKVRTGPSLCCGPGNRGVAVYDGKVYVGTLDARLVALDAETGKVVWSVQTADKNSDYSITGAPLIVKDKVIIGNGGGEFAVRGFISAYDAETGKLDWRFYTVPGDPSKPFENKAMEAAAKTWSPDIPWWKLGGGGNPWNAISYDPKLDLLYFGTGQAGPWVQKYRSAMGQDNLYISSIIAVKPETGKFVWYFQTTPGDEWDLRCDRRSGSRGYEDRREAAPRDHAGAEERVLLRDRSQDWEIHFRRGAAKNYLGQGPRSEDRPADRSIPRRTTARRRPSSGRGRAAGTCGRECRSIPQTHLVYLTPGMASQLQLRAGDGIQARARDVQLGNRFPGCGGQRHGPARSRWQWRAASTAASSDAARWKFPRGVGSGDGNGAAGRCPQRVAAAR